MIRVLAMFAVLASTFAAVAPPVAALEPKPAVRLRALDKLTGDTSDFTVKTGRTVTFGRLEMTVRSCWQSLPEDTPESAAFLEVQALPPAKRSEEAESAGAEPLRLFSGWMFASSPGLSALEHPVYDVWVISCTTP